VPLTGNQRTPIAFDFLPAWTHDPAADIFPFSIMNSIKLVELSAHDAAVRFTFGIYI
jgi:hypothetical protein